MAGIYTVSQINSYIKNMFAQDFALNNIYIKGEISNCKYHSSGHIYFTLKDKSSVMAGVMFSGNRGGLNFELKEGQNVIALGSVNVYERDGKYQLYANEIILDGAGQLYQQFEALKKELEEMGMFSEEYKKPIPLFALKVGIVTARTGAAIKDIKTISNRRNPFVQLYLYEALVQGDGAAASIVQGIQTLDQLQLDVIIVGRGGGSIEDLWAFNKAEVARAIFNCNTPVISAVGHETDITIADYVADLRASTPSAAAELAVFEYSKFNLVSETYKNTLNSLMYSQINRNKNMLEQYTLKLKYFGPANQLLQKKQYLIELENRIKETMNQNLMKDKHRLALICEQLKGLSPLNQLSRGYAFVLDNKDRPLKSMNQVKKEDTIKVYLKDGILSAGVKEVNKQELG